MASWAPWHRRYVYLLPVLFLTAGVSDFHALPPGPFLSAHDSPLWHRGTQKLPTPRPPGLPTPRYPAYFYKRTCFHLHIHRHFTLAHLEPPVSWLPGVFKSSG